MASDPSAEVWRSALALTLAIAAGLAVGALVPGTGAVAPLALPALGLQTFLTVGSLPPIRGTDALRGGLVLLGVHHLVASVPVAAAGVLLGLDGPVGFGVFLMGIAPPAALIPAYARVLRVDVGPLLVFCLIGYGLALVTTPLLLLAVAGAVVGVGPIALTLAVGLIGPALLARLLHRRLVRVPERARRALVNVAVLVITLGLGGGIPEAATSGAVGSPDLAAIGAVLIGRTIGSGWLATRIAPTALRAEAPLAGVFKNIALAAAVAGTLLEPVAALPALLGFPAEEDRYSTVNSWLMPSVKCGAPGGDASGAGDSPGGGSSSSCSRDVVPCGRKQTAA